MQIHIFQDEKQTGPFPLDAVHNMKRLGSVNDTAMVWHDGLTDWQPIGPFLAANQPSRPLSVAAPPFKAAAPAKPKAVWGPAQTSPAPKPEPSDVNRLMRSILAGGVAALISGAVWIGIAVGVGIQIGWLAWGIGWLCGLAVSNFGRGNGAVFQLIAVLCALAGIAIGKVGILLAGYMPFSLFDILWVILAVASAWKTAGGGDD